jgi:hypothetical protein
VAVPALIDLFLSIVFPIMFTLKDWKYKMYNITGEKKSNLHEGQLMRSKQVNE